MKTHDGRAARCRRAGVVARWSGRVAARIVLRFAPIVFGLMSLAAPPDSAVGQSPPEERPRPPDARRVKKLIETGWDMPDTARLRAQLEEIESRPFDGVVVRVVGRDAEGKARPLNWAHTAEPWRFEWFTEAVEDLKACRFRRLTDNFIVFNANRGDVDWFDDEGWSQIVDHWRIAARVARLSGVKGILFDPEPYSPPASQFAYTAQARRAEHDFAEYCVQARRRGREIMEAVAAEYPDITLFCYFLNSVNLGATGRADPRAALERSGYGLLPSMLDGWLDALPSGARLIDGCESAYRYNSALEYCETAVRIKGDAQELVSPENRAKYRAAVEVGFGLYLDAYCNPPDSPWYIDGLGGQRVDRLRANARTALAAADQYVWVYGEKFRWWATDNPRVDAKTWPEALPGCDEALRFARDPVDAARAAVAAMRRDGRDENLLTNGDFSAERRVVAGREEVGRDGGRPIAWSAWQAESSRGRFEWDRREGRTGAGSARAAGAANGCFLQACDVQPGQRYVAWAWVRQTGRGQPALRVRWQTPEGRWTAESRDVLALAEPAGQTVISSAPNGAPTVQPWRELIAAVEAPPEAGKLLMLLLVDGQQVDEDVVWFDDAALYRLP